MPYLVYILIDQSFIDEDEVLELLAVEAFHGLVKSCGHRDCEAKITLSNRLRLRRTAKAQLPNLRQFPQ